MNTLTISRSVYSPYADINHNQNDVSKSRKLVTLPSFSTGKTPESLSSEFPEWLTEPPATKEDVSDEEVDIALQELADSLYPNNKQVYSNSSRMRALKETATEKVDDLVMMLALNEAGTFSKANEMQIKALAVMAERLDAVSLERVKKVREECDKAVEQAQKAKKGRIASVCFDWALSVVQIGFGIAKLAAGIVTFNPLWIVGGALNIAAGAMGAVKATLKTLALADPKNAATYDKIAGVFEAIETVITVVAVLVDITSAVFKGLAKVSAKIGARLVESGKKLVFSMQKFADAGKGVALAVMKGSPDALRAALKNMVQAAQHVFMYAVKFGKALAKVVVHVVKEAAKGLVETVKAVVKNIIAFIKKCIRAIKKTLTSITSASFTPQNILAKLGKLLGKITIFSRQMLSGLWDGLKGMYQSLKNAVPDYIKAWNPKSAQDMKRFYDASQTYIYAAQSAIVGASKVVGGVNRIQRSKLDHDIGMLKTDQAFLDNVSNDIKGMTRQHRARLTEQLGQQNEMRARAARLIREQGALRVQIAGTIA